MLSAASSEETRGILAERQALLLDQDRWLRRQRRVPSDGSPSDDARSTESPVPVRVGIAPHGTRAGGWRLDLQSMRVDALTQDDMARSRCWLINLVGERDAAFDRREAAR